MIKNKNLIIGMFFLILFIQIGFFGYSILAVEHSPNIEDFDFLELGEDNEFQINEDDEFIEISLVENGSVKIGESVFENIKEGKILVDYEGNILSVDLIADKEGCSLSFNGLDFEVPPEQSFSCSFYDKYCILGEGTKLNKFDNSFFEGEKFRLIGKNVNLFDEVFIEDGTALLDDRGLFLERGEAIYNGVRLSDDFDREILFVEDFSILSSYEGNWVQKTSKGMDFNSEEEWGKMRVEFLRDNPFFDFDYESLEQNEERVLTMTIANGDFIEFYEGNKDFGISPGIVHKSSEYGETIIMNGKHDFKLEKGKFLNEFGGLNKRKFFSVPFEITSDSLPSKTLSIDDDNGYVLFDSKTENKIVFDKTLLDNPNYNFKSEVGKELYYFAENQIGDSAFIYGGRGDIYYDEYDSYAKKEVPLDDIKGYDCIGLAITGLNEIYPENSIRDFPPNLKLVNTLENKGWTSFVLEPSSVVGKGVALKNVKNIPAGSIVFAMDAEKKSEEGEYLFKGIATKEYTNKKNEELILTIGHTLIRGAGEKNFINAIPGYVDLIPKRAKEYNEYLESKGEGYLFEGVIKEGELVPEYDYWIVISPPEN